MFAVSELTEKRSAEAKKFLEKALQSKAKFDNADDARKLLASIKG